MGEAYGAITIVCGLPLSRGIALGVDLKVEAEVELTEDDSEEMTSWVRGHRVRMGGELLRALRKILKLFEFEGGLKVRITSEIPPERGLKSSSAVSNALILAAMEALGEKLEPLEILRLSVKLSRMAGITLTGALDDACASLLGGLCAADSKEMRIIARRRVPEFSVGILVPERRVPTSSLRSIDFSPYAGLFEEIFRKALEEDWIQAMTENGKAMCNILGYSQRPITEALRSGALGAGLSGKGPAFAAIFEGEASWGNMVTRVRS